MGSVIFDFDSTLVSHESLEEVVAPRLRSDPALAREYAEITRRGMEGSWSFAESLRTRLDLAAPTRAEITAFVERLDEYWTRGIPELVRELSAAGAQVWIVSGAFLDVLWPAAERLGIPTERVMGVTVLWRDDGSLEGPDPEDPFSRSKVEGVRASGVRWDRPAVVVGDGMTDRELAESGLAEEFVAFTGNVRRGAVVQLARYEARDVGTLRALLSRLLG